MYYMHPSLKYWRYLKVALSLPSHPEEAITSKVASKEFSPTCRGFRLDGPCFGWGNSAGNPHNSPTLQVPNCQLASNCQIRQMNVKEHRSELEYLESFGKHFTKTHGRESLQVPPHSSVLDLQQDFTGRSNLPEMRRWVGTIIDRMSSHQMIFQFGGGPNLMHLYFGIPRYVSENGIYYNTGDFKRDGLTHWILGSKLSDFVTCPSLSHLSHPLTLDGFGRQIIEQKTGRGHRQQKGL